MKIKMAAALCLALAVFAGCMKEESATMPAGKGGSGAISVTVIYEGRGLSGVPVYLDWTDPAQKSAADLSADDTAITYINATAPTATFGDLRAGRYYLSASILDSARNQVASARQILMLRDADTLAINLELRRN